MALPKRHVSIAVAEWQSGRREGAMRVRRGPWATERDARRTQEKAGPRRHREPVSWMELRVNLRFITVSFHSKFFTTRFALPCAAFSVSKYDGRILTQTPGFLQ